MEKSVLEYIAGIPVIGWLAYLHMSRPSKGVCKAKHDALCIKMEDMHKDVREIRDRLIDHLESK